mgnify:CR=1 FL=1
MRHLMNPLDFSTEEIEQMARDEKFADDISALIQKVV